MGRLHAREKHAIGVAKFPLPRPDNPAAKRKVLYGAKSPGSKHHCALNPPCENSPCPDSRKMNRSRSRRIRRR